MKEHKLTFPVIFSETVKKHGNRKSFGFVDSEQMTYSKMDRKVKATISFLEKNGIKKGSKVALLSANMPNWGVSYLATVSLGAVIVPLLPDFSKNEVENIIKHSEAEVLFISTALKKKLGNFNTGSIHSLVELDELKVVHSKANAEISLEDISERVYNVQEDDLATIIYTSGTTGKSKGVMLSHKNIISNAIAGSKVQPITHNDRFLSILPLSHTYENTLGFVLPMLFGAQVYYIKKAPSPAVLLNAMKKVRPTMMLTVPLIIEKIYKNKIAPSFQKKAIIRTLYKVAPIRKVLNKIAGKKLLQSFGGELKFFGIGGAKLDKTVEKFLIEAKFPYAIGYGLTETAPLCAGTNPKSKRLQSTGPAVDGVQLKIHNPDPKTGEGEVWIKGPNVMQGYYKEPELTKSVLTNDGWFKSGDLAVFDKNDFLFIKGRSKNVIIGASGENIYPEEIESVINNFKHVAESIVIEQKGKLVALVHLNLDELEARYKSFKTDLQNQRDELQVQIEENIDELLKELHTYVNTNVNKFSQLQQVVFYPQPFEKTATQKIKRFIYA